MAKIFISHSVRDGELIRILVDFLQMGMGIGRSEIFCTSYPETLPTGENFIEEIRRQMVNCEAVFFMLTDNFLKSQFCLTEMGAAWGLGKRIYPLLLVNLDKLERTPLKGLQVRFLNKENDVSAIYDELRNDGIITRTSTAEYMRRLPEFIQEITAQSDGEYILTAAEDGYYHTEIVAERYVPDGYRCYGIKGHIKEWRDVDSAETDWLFYRADVYEDLKVGEKVRFKIHRTEEKRWQDIGIARNIYPADLRID